MEQELFLFLATHLKIRLFDASEPSSCGGEVEGSLGVKVELLLKNPETGEDEVISSDSLTLG